MVGMWCVLWVPRYFERAMKMDSLIFWLAEVLVVVDLYVKWELLGEETKGLMAERPKALGEQSSSSLLVVLVVDPVWLNLVMLVSELADILVEQPSHVCIYLLLLLGVGRLRD